MDLAPSTLTASDVGHAARLIKGTEAASRLLATREALDAIDTESVPILPNGEDDNDVDDGDLSALNESVRFGKGGVSSDSIAAWILGLPGGIDALVTTGWNPITRNVMGVGTNSEDSANNTDEKKKKKGEEDEQEETSESRLDFSTKKGAYTVWRASWEDKHGAPARKERELDALVPPEGPTWARADPQPFRVLRLSQGANPSVKTTTQ